jgi:hypothetical protein
MLMVHYLTPSSFKFEDHRNQATYRRVATAGMGELERLVLGAN